MLVSCLATRLLQEGLSHPFGTRHANHACRIFVFFFREDVGGQEALEVALTLLATTVASVEARGPVAVADLLLPASDVPLQQTLHALEARLASCCLHN